MIMRLQYHIPAVQGSISQVGAQPATRIDHIMLAVREIYKERGGGRERERETERERERGRERGFSTTWSPRSLASTNKKIPPPAADTL
jgi:hypothetical protein